MPISRKMLVQDDQDDNQWLNVDNDTRYVTNDMDDWQYLFGRDTKLTASVQLLKIGVELDANALNSLRFVAYLYNPTSGGVDNAATCDFKVYKVDQSGWVDSLVLEFSGTKQSNQYFFATQPLSGFTTMDFDGGATLMVEAIITRLGVVQKNRVYINHLGIYDTFLRLKQQVEFLDITKADE